MLWKQGRPEAFLSMKTLKVRTDRSPHEAEAAAYNLSRLSRKSPRSSCLPRLPQPALSSPFSSSQMPLSLTTFSSSSCVDVSGVSDSVRPHGLWPARLLSPRDSPGKNPGVGCPALLQGIFLTGGSNPGLLHCRRIPHCLSHEGSPLFISPTLMNTC